MPPISSDSNWNQTDTAQLEYSRSSFFIEMENSNPSRASVIRLRERSGNRSLRPLFCVLSFSYLDWFQSDSTLTFLHSKNLKSGITELRLWNTFQLLPARPRKRKDWPDGGMSVAGGCCPFCLNNHKRWFAETTISRVSVPAVGFRAAHLESLPALSWHYYIWLALSSRLEY